MQFSTGFEEVANSTGVTSGVLPAPANRVATAKCELLPETDTSGADLTFDRKPLLVQLQHCSCCECEWSAWQARQRQRAQHGVVVAHRPSGQKTLCDVLTSMPLLSSPSPPLQPSCRTWWCPAPAPPTAVSTTVPAALFYYERCVLRTALGAGIALSHGAL